MAKVQAELQVPVTFLKEGKQFIAYSTALDLSVCGKTLAEARKRFGEAAMLLMEELGRKGTLEEVFTSLGWRRKDSVFIPPIVIGQEQYRLPVPA